MRVLALVALAVLGMTAAAEARPLGHGDDFRAALLDRREVGRTRRCVVAEVERVTDGKVRARIGCWNGAMAVPVELIGRVGAIKARQQLRLRIVRAGGREDQVAATARVVGLDGRVPDPPPPSRCLCDRDDELWSPPAASDAPADDAGGLDAAAAGAELRCRVQIVEDLARSDAAAESYTLAGQVPAKVAPLVARVWCRSTTGVSRLIIGASTPAALLLLRRGGLVSVEIWRPESTPVGIFRQNDDVPDDRPLP